MTRDDVWGIAKRVSDYYGRIRLVTRAGMHLAPLRQFRRDLEKAGLVARSGRQWVKLRKRMVRQERRQELQQKEAA